MWVTMRATESERKGLVRGLVKGWQAVGNAFSFPRAVNALSMLLSMPSSDGVQALIHISTLKKKKRKNGNMETMETAAEQVEGLKERRKRNGLTQERFSEMLGISRGHLNQIETGARKASPQLLKKIDYFLVSL